MPDLSIEEIIRQAITDGKFDDLPGKGKPLQLDQEAHENPEWRAAYHILRSSGFTLPWIESLHDIESRLERVRADLTRTWNWCQEHRENPMLDVEWTRALETFRSQIEIINKEIRHYNLEVPSDRFQRPMIDPDQEVEHLTQPVDS